MAGEKTEKATPKRREEARQKGTVARSQDLNGAVVLLAGLIVLGMTGPMIAERLASGMRTSLSAGATADVVQQHTVFNLVGSVMGPAMIAMLPLIGACALAAILVNLGQVGVKPATQALKPDLKRLDPVQGTKNVFGINAVVETGKGIIKIGVVGAVVLMALLPRLSELAGLVGISPLELSSEMARQIRSIAMRAAIVYLIIGILDFFYQRWRTEKSLKMDKQEVKDEAKNMDLPPEVKAAIRRRQMEAARARMMADIPLADVVVTNPTHYAVALKYEAGSAAPIVVAKGMDHLAAKIREIAQEAGVPIVPDPPLARALHRMVEVGREIPEDLFEAVAAVLAHVYRLAGRRRSAS
ncbi:MAG: flagellar biosynthesis protein FlhB [Baekduia sp.]